MSYFDDDKSDDDFVARLRASDDRTSYYKTLEGNTLEGNTLEGLWSDDELSDEILDARAREVLQCDISDHPLLDEYQELLAEDEKKSIFKSHAYPEITVDDEDRFFVLFNKYVGNMLRRQFKKAELCKKEAELNAANHAALEHGSGELAYAKLDGASYDRLDDDADDDDDFDADTYSCAFRVNDKLARARAIKAQNITKAQPKARAKPVPWKVSKAKAKSKQP